MKTPQFLTSLWEKIKKQRREESHLTDEHQEPSTDLPPYRHRAVHHHPTPHEVQYHTAEQEYWQEQLRLAQHLNVITKTLNTITVWATGFAGLAALAGFASIFILWCTLVETIENDRMEQRAWVGLGPIQILNRMTTSEPFRINARVQNSGSSPALGFLAFSKLGPLRTADGDERVPFLEQFDFAPCVGPKPQWRDGLGGTVMMPDAQVDSLDGSSDIPKGKFVEIVTSHTDQKGVPLSPEDLAAVPLAPGTPADTKVWQFRLYFVGCLNYFDIFHEAHRTSFCFRYVSSNVSSVGTFGACLNGNYAD